MSETDMIEGYRDGRDVNSPEPSSNRSHSYRHGFANGRDDLANKPRDSAANLRELAAAAIAADDENGLLRAGIDTGFGLPGGAARPLQRARF